MRDVNDINWSQFGFTSDITIDAYGNNVHGYYLQYMHEKMHICHDEIISDTRVANFLNVKRDQRFRKTLFVHNKEVFWRTSMNDELREMVIDIDSDQQRQLDHYKSEAFILLCKWEKLATDIYGKKKQLKYFGGELYE